MEFRLNGGLTDTAESKVLYTIHQMTAGEEKMVSYVEFFIDNKPYTTSKAVLTVSDILAYADLSTDDFILISSENAEFRNAKEEIEVQSGDHFTTKKWDRDSKPEFANKIHYRVNGEQQDTAEASLSVEQILRTAGKATSIDLQQLHSYILEDLKTGSSYENLSEIVTISNGDEFLAIHSGATPVAFS